MQDDLVNISIMSILKRVLIADTGLDNKIRRKSLNIVVFFPINLMNLSFLWDKD